MAALTGLISLSGCNQQESSGLSICASFYPLYDFAQKIVGSKGEVTNITPAGSEPHDYDLSGSNVKKLAQCDLFLLNGIGLEPYADSLPEEIQGKAFVCTSGLSVRTASDGSTSDPHVWLSLTNAKAIMKNIKDRIVTIDPANSDYYESNYASYEVLFSSLDEAMASTISAFANKYLLLTHEFLGYFCEDYGLTGLSICGLSPEQEPTPAKINETIAAIKEHGIKTVFYENTSSDAIAKSIASEAGCQTAALYSLESQLDPSKDYLSTMAANLTALKKAKALEE